MAKAKGLFYAYPSRPQELSDTIEAAAAKIRQSTKLKVRTWRNLSPTGNYIIEHVLDAIREAEIFACDLTYGNPNVLFELGFAIARLKRLWITLNTTIQGAREGYDRLNSSFLPSVGYASYENSDQLSQAFANNRPWISLEDPILGKGFDFKARKPSDPTLLYLKQPSDTESSVALSEALQRSLFERGLFIDNPKDNPTSSLAWYAEKVRDADAVVTHLLSAEHSGHEFHNLRCSLIAGLAAGFSRPFLMLAPEPYETPVDYRGMLLVHSSPKQCVALLGKWLTEIEPQIPKRRARRPVDLDAASASLDLRSLQVGEWVAEHESGFLDDYFVETSWYYDALQGRQAIFVGRRGTGKTATLYQLEAAVGSNRLNHVCVIKPVGYEVHGLIRMLSQQLGFAERGYLLESLWKYLIFTELAISAAREIRAKPAFQIGQLAAHEVQLLTFISEHSEVIEAPFSVRLDRAIQPLLDLAASVDSKAQRARISESLHVTTLRDLRTHVGNVLTSKRRVVVLIDNLDEPWGPGEHVDLLAELFLGLLRVSIDITDDLRRADFWRKDVNASVIVFLRSDIFFHLQRLHPEQDKLPVERVTWRDSELVLRLVDERLRSSLGRKWPAEEIWGGLFANAVAGLPPREFIGRWSVTRPRDVIFFTREAIAIAVNRGHKVVGEEDLFEARRRYSEFAFRAVLAEDDPRKQLLEKVLYEFAGAPTVITVVDVERRLDEAGVADDDHEFYIDLLCDLNFLGIYTRDGYRFAMDEGERKMLREVARRILRTTGRSKSETFEINRAFHDVLQIR
jgi:hypothetical protein